MLREQKKRKSGKSSSGGRAASSTAEPADHNPQKGPLSAILSKRKAVTGHLPTKAVDPVLEAEDREIARLEKLLFGESGDKRNKASKLNHEFEIYEGLGSGVGEFLLELDELTERMKKGDAPLADPILIPEVDLMPEEADPMEAGHVLDDNEQEVSDIDKDEDPGPGQSLDEDVDEGVEDEGYEGSDAVYEGGDVDDDMESQEGGDRNEDRSYTYGPSEGQDIYGRPLKGLEADSHDKPSTYLHVTVDENSETYKALRRQINGLLNRLSEQTKDSITRSLKAVYEGNSVTITSHALNSCVTNACSNSSQIMTTLTPLYSAVIAALHFTVGVEAGAFILEKTFLRFDQILTEEHHDAAETEEHSLISDKLPANLLMLIVYLYNFRVIHHILIIEILDRLTSGWKDIGNEMKPMEAELILIIIEHCGASLRNDDPMSLKRIIGSVNQRVQNMQENKRYL